MMIRKDFQIIWMSVHMFMFFIILLSLYPQAKSIKTDLTVAQDGTGQYRKIQDAIKAAPNNSERRFYIKVKAGVYRELVFVGLEKTRISLIGEGMDNTRIVGNRSTGAGYTTENTSTVEIFGSQFVAINITFENEAGPQNAKAVALSSHVESAFYKCRFLGYQDTLFADKGRQFYRECQISGTIDFIYGSAIVVFQFCNIIVREPLSNQHNVITAQGRLAIDRQDGTILHRCQITPSAEFVHRSIKSYLGRPWKTYSRVVIMLSKIDSIIDPKGWELWDNSTQVDKMFYAEYNNTGPGSDTSSRVQWPGFKRLNSAKQANMYTVRNFINGSDWIPSTGIPFDLDL